MEEKKKMSKYYNPYPFLARVLNDLEAPQLLAPQAHCKVMGGEYGQSPLELVPVDKRGERVYRTGMKIELRRLLKEDLVNLAWAVLVAESREELESMSQKDLIAAIKAKTGEKLLGEEDLEPGDPGVDIEQKPETSEGGLEEKVEEDLEEKVEVKEEEKEVIEEQKEETSDEESQDEKKTVIEKKKPQESKSRKRRRNIQED